MTSPAAASPTPPAGPAPTSVRVAVGLLGALALLLLISAGLTLAGRDTVVDQFLAAQPDLARADVERAVLLGQVRYLLVAVAALVSVVFLLRRRSWARWLGLLATLFLGLLTLLSVVSTGGAAISSLLVVVLCVGAVSSLMAKTTAAWAPGRPRRA